MIMLDDPLLGITTGKTTENTRAGCKHTGVKPADIKD